MVQSLTYFQKTFQGPFKITSNNRLAIFAQILWPALSSFKKKKKKKVALFHGWLTSSVWRQSYCWVQLKKEVQRGRAQMAEARDGLIASATKEMVSLMNLAMSSKHRLSGSWCQPGGHAHRCRLVRMKCHRLQKLYPTVNKLVVAESGSVLVQNCLVR